MNKQTRDKSQNSFGMAVEMGYYWEYQDKTQPYIQAWNSGSQTRYNTILGGEVCYMSMRVCHARKVRRVNPYLCTYHYCCVRGTRIVYEPLFHERHASKNMANTSYPMPITRRINAGLNTTS